MTVGCISLRSMLQSLIITAVTITLGFMLAIVHLVFVTRGALYGGCGKHQWEIGLDRLISTPALEVCVLKVSYNDQAHNLQQSYVTVIVISPAVGLIKMSLLIQYYHLFNMRRYIRICVWIAAVVFGLFYVSLSITAFILNSPWHGESLIETVVSWHYLKFTGFAIPTGAIGMAFDWFLLILPMPAVWNLHLSLSRKLGLVIIFATGGL
jgi:hypothetical protein